MQKEPSNRDQNWPPESEPRSLITLTVNSSNVVFSVFGNLKDAAPDPQANLTRCAATSGKPRERTVIQSWRMALRATLTSPRFVAPALADILSAFAWLIHPWISRPVACRRSASLKDRLTVPSRDFPTAITGFGYRDHLTKCRYKPIRSKVLFLQDRLKHGCFKPSDTGMCPERVLQKEHLGPERRLSGYL